MASMDHLKFGVLTWNVLAHKYLRDYKLSAAVDSRKLLDAASRRQSVESLLENNMHIADVFCLQVILPRLALNWPLLL